MTLQQIFSPPHTASWFDNATAPPPTIFKKIKSKLSGIRRDYVNATIANRNPRARHEPWPDHGYSVFGVTDKFNGLSRAYRYEIERLKEQNLYNPNSRNVIILGQPRQWRKLFKSRPACFANAYRIGLWVTEFEESQPDWDFAFPVVNEVWTPSEFSARAFRGQTDLPVRVVPHSVKVGNELPMERSRFCINQDAFLGLAIMDLGACPDRKNPIAHIKAWQNAFQDNNTAQLVIKARFSRHKPFVREALKSAIGPSTNIQIIEAEFSDAEMEAFQRMADVYLSLHRTEGYGLNIHQMLELGIPTVATGWSGNMDFMPQYRHAFAVPYQLIPYQDPTLYYRGKDLKWAEADIEAAARILRSLYQETKMTSPICEDAA